VFFLSEEERRLVLRKLLPRARRNEVHPELRGWRWNESPIAPAYDVPLGVAEIAAQYCGRGRDLYLRRVVGVKVAATPAMVEGRLLHEAVAEQLQGAVRLLHGNPVDRVLGLLERGADPPAVAMDPTLSAEAAWELQRKISLLTVFEHHRVMSRVAEVLARQPRVGAGGLATLALPVALELPLDGRLLGLSAHLRADAVSFFAPMITDLKFGARREFHRLATAGYAMVMESLYECPIDLGCVTYVGFEGDRVVLDRDIHLIDDELRQWFLEVRDERMRMVAEGMDPGRAEECPEGCGYWRVCWE
jgi:CRISPR-associated protein Csa1